MTRNEALAVVCPLYSDFDQAKSVLDIRAACSKLFPSDATAEFYAEIEEEKVNLSKKMFELTGLSIDPNSVLFYWRSAINVRCKQENIFA